MDCISFKMNKSVELRMADNPCQCTTNCDHGGCGCTSNNRSCTVDCSCTWECKNDNTTDVIRILKDLAGNVQSRKDKAKEIEQVIQRLEDDLKKANAKIKRLEK
jgi:hypothetical protein